MKQTEGRPPYAIRVKRVSQKTGKVRYEKNHTSRKYATRHSAQDAAILVRKRLSGRPGVECVEIVNAENVVVSTYMM